MTRNDIRRAAQHFPAGFFTAWLGTFTLATTLVFGIGFLTYEVMEDWRIKDRGYHDVYGFLIGIAFGSVLFWLLLL